MPPPVQADADTVLLCLQTLSHFDFYTGNEEQAYQAMTSLTRTVLVRLLHEQVGGVIWIISLLIFRLGMAIW